MKLLPFFIFLLPITMTAQTKADYVNVMTKFQRFYNGGYGDSISAMFSPGDSLDFKPEDIKFLWSNEAIKKPLEKLGTLKSFKFIGIDKSDPQHVYVFKTLFSKVGEKTTSMTLDKKNRVRIFRLTTTSEGITPLLKKDKLE